MAALLKFSMASGIPLSNSPAMKPPYTRRHPTVHYNNNTPRVVSLRSWGTRGRGEYIKRSSTPRNRKKRPPRAPCPMDPSDEYDNPIVILRELNHGFVNWCDKQSVLVGVTSYVVVQCLVSYLWTVIWTAFIGALGVYVPISQLEEWKDSCGIYYPLLFGVFGGPFVLGRSYAVVKACTFGLSYAMKRLRGKGSDRLTIMMMGFVAPVMYSLVAGMRSPVIVAIGVIFALICGLMHKLWCLIFKA